MAPPSSLPSWWQINEIVLESLARRLEAFMPAKFTEKVRNELITTRDRGKYFSPDYQAQIMEDECGAEYFRVLQALDVEEVNGNHTAIAALAKAGRVAAVVTTNFDLLLERALQAAGVEHRVFRSADEYLALKQGEGPLPVVKVHGSVEDPASMVDTLRQRLRGRPKALEQFLCDLMKRHHVLFAGFSGADLAYDENYLGLRAAATQNCGFTCLVRPDTQANPAMVSLQAAWGEGARFQEAMLPEWFSDLLSELGAEPPPPIAAEIVDRKPALAAYADAWSSSIGHMTAVSIMAELLESTGRGDLAYKVLLNTYNSGGELRDPEARGYARYNYQLGRRLLDRGEFGFPIDSLRRRQVEREPLLSRFHASDCYQCLQRGQAGAFADAHISIAWYEALHGFPKASAERLRQIRNTMHEAGRPLPFVDSCRTLATVYEILMHYADALDWLERAYAVARSAGDEPRRARICAELARFLAMKRRFGEAHEKVAEAQTVVDRLELRIAQLEVWSAEGSVLVEERRPSEALEKLRLAMDGYREAGLRPALLRTMIDLGYTAYQLRDQALFDHVQDHIFDLADAFPGYSPLVALMMARLMRGGGNTEASDKFVEETKRLARLYQNPGAAEEADLVAAPRSK